jgi:hypothetical protein
MEGNKVITEAGHRGYYRVADQFDIPSQQKHLAEATAFAEKKIADLTRRLRRPPTDKELFNGLEHKDSRSTLERTEAKAGWDRLFAEIGSDPRQKMPRELREAYAELDAHTRKLESEKDPTGFALRERIRKMETAIETQRAKEERENSKEYISTVEKLRLLKSDLLDSPWAEQGDVEDADRAIDYFVQGGPATTALEIHDKIKRRYGDRVLEAERQRREELQAKLQQVREEFNTGDTGDSNNDAT